MRRNERVNRKGDGCVRLRNTVFKKHQQWTESTSSGNSQAFYDVETRRGSLSKVDVFRHRNLNHVAVLVDILADGYSLAYRELFNLIKDEEKVERQNPSCVNYVLLKNDSETLSQVASVLCSCEDFARLGIFQSCYQERSLMGKHFKECRKRALALHFYRTAAQEARKIDNAETQLECQAEADLEYGQRLHEEGLITEAQTYVEIAYQNLCLSEKKGSELHRECCKVLSNITIAIADEIVNRAHRLSSNTKRLYVEAYSLAKESKDLQYFQQTCIGLSETFRKYNNPEVSRKFLMKVKTESNTSDIESFSKACRELAKTYSTSWKIDEALRVLDRSNKELELAKKREGFCGQLDFLKGMNYNLQCKLYNGKGSFERATESGRNAMYYLLNTSKAASQPIHSKESEASSSVAKVNFAISRTHVHFADYVNVLQQERDDYDKPEGLLACKMRGLTAQLLYLDQNSNIKTFQKKKLTPAKFISGTGILTAADPRISVGARDTNKSYSRTTVSQKSSDESQKRESDSHNFAPDCFSQADGRENMIDYNFSALSEDILSGLFPDNDTNDSNYSYYSYEYYTSDEDDDNDNDNETYGYEDKLTEDLGRSHSNCHTTTNNDTNN